MHAEQRPLAATVHKVQTRSKRCIENCLVLAALDLFANRLEPYVEGSHLLATFRTCDHSSDDSVRVICQAPAGCQIKSGSLPGRDMGLTQTPKSGGMVGGHVTGLGAGVFHSLVGQAEALRGEDVRALHDVAELSEIIDSPLLGRVGIDVRLPCERLTVWAEESEVTHDLGVLPAW